MGWYHLLETSRELGSRRCRMGGLRGQLAPGLRWKQLPVPGGRITRSGRRGEAVGGFLRRVLFHEARLTSKNRASWPLCNPATGCNWRRRISGGAVRARAGQRAHKTARSPQCDLRRDLPASPEHGLQPTCRSRSHELLLAGHVRRQRRARCSAVQRGQYLVRCWSWRWRWRWSCRLPVLELPHACAAAGPRPLSTNAETPGVHARRRAHHTSTTPAQQSGAKLAQHPALGATQRSGTGHRLGPIAGWSNHYQARTAPTVRVASLRALPLLARIPEPSQCHSPAQQAPTVHLPILGSCQLRGS